jgi:hypothetical protein
MSASVEQPPETSAVLATDYMQQYMAELVEGPVLSNEARPALADDQAYYIGSLALTNDL